MKSANPFAEMDFSKIMGELPKFMGEFKVPSMDVESIVHTQRKNFEAFAACQQLAVEGFQAIAKRQTDIVREAIEDMSKAGRELSGMNGSMEARVAKQAELAKAGFEKALANQRELSELVAKSNTEAFDVLTARFAEALDEVKDAAVNGKGVKTAVSIQKVA